MHMKIKRPARVTFLVTEAERETLDKLAEAAGVTVSEWIRARVREAKALLRRRA